MMVCLQYFKLGKNELYIFKALLMLSTASRALVWQHQTKALHAVLSIKKCINYCFDSPCGSSEKEHPADECLFFSRHVPTLVNNFYDNKKLQFFISDFSLPRVTQAAAKCTVLYCYYLFLHILTFLSKLLIEALIKTINWSWIFKNS